MYLGYVKKVENGYELILRSQTIYGDPFNLFGALEGKSVNDFSTLEETFKSYIALVKSIEENGKLFSIKKENIKFKKNVNDIPVPPVLPVRN